MNWSKALGYPALIWVIIFVVISALVPSGLAEAAWVSYLTVAIVAVLAWVLASKLGVNKVNEGLSYGVVWVIVALVLDYLISRPFAPDIFSSWNVWVGYALLLVVPMLRVSDNKTA